MLRERAVGFDLRGGVAAIQLLRGECPAIDEERLDPPCALGERLAEDGGPAIVGRPWQAAAPQLQTMSRAISRPLAGDARVAE